MIQPQTSKLVADLRPTLTSIRTSVIRPNERSSFFPQAAESILAKGPLNEAIDFVRSRIETDKPLDTKLLVESVSLILP